jgi:PPOX class probable F420-dependent enzyme
MQGPEQRLRQGCEARQQHGGAETPAERAGSGEPNAPERCVGAAFVVGSAMRSNPAPARELSEEERRFLAERRVGHLATADRGASPHVVPVCFAASGAALYVTVDEKPKGGAPLKRLRNIAENPAAAVVVDRYDEDWTRLGWVMLRGRAEILRSGDEHDEAQALLRRRYPQLQPMRIAALPVIALRIESVTSWGDLSPDQE